MSRRRDGVPAVTIVSGRGSAESVAVGAGAAVVSLAVAAGAALCPGSCGSCATCATNVVSTGGLVAGLAATVAASALLRKTLSTGRRPDPAEREGRP